MAIFTFLLVTNSFDTLTCKTHDNTQTQRTQTTMSYRWYGHGNPTSNTQTTPDQKNKQTKKQITKKNKTTKFFKLCLIFRDNLKKLCFVLFVLFCFWGQALFVCLVRRCFLVRLAEQCRATSAGTSDGQCQKLPSNVAQPRLAPGTGNRGS